MNIYSYEQSGDLLMLDDVCQVQCFNAERVARVKSKMSPEVLISDLSAIFKVLSDPTRVKIIQALAMEELCVCDIAQLLGMSQSAVSHQLRLLRTAKLVKYRREGKMAYYSLVDECVRSLLSEGLRHVGEGEAETSGENGARWAI
jgi:DNA-binding transcriptional ArsR family regulator